VETRFEDGEGLSEGSLMREYWLKRDRMERWIQRENEILVGWTWL